MSDPRVIVALDFPKADRVLAFIDRVDPARCRLKVGMELYTAAGPELVRRLIDRGFDVFLDLKYHDIPTTVARACTQAAELGVWMLNVHTLGGGEMLAAARAAIDQARHQPILVGVTLLTSHDAAALAQIGLDGGIGGQVERLARLAYTAGLDGVVCSAAETAALRRQFGAGFVLVTPGIRQEGDAHDDQRRTRSPIEAIADGADYLVIGRPVTRAADPAAALDTIQQQIRAH